MASEAQTEQTGLADETVREVVGVFHDEVALEAAIDDLQECGFDRADISLLASDAAIAAKLGHAYEKVTELADESVVRTAYISREDYGAAEGGLISGLVYVGALAGVGAVVASGGALGGALLAAALSGGAGGAVGLALVRWLDRHRAQRLSDQLERGGLLLWVHVRDSEQEGLASKVLRDNGAEDVHLHDLTLAHAESRAAGWSPYPPLLTFLELVVRYDQRSRAGR